MANLCLEIVGNIFDHHAPIKASSCKDIETQYFTFRRSSEDNLFYNIVSLNSSKCLDVDRQSREPMAALHQWGCGDYMSQRFILEKIPEQAKVLPKIIWTFWENGAENMPAFYKANIEVWKRRLGSMQNI